MPFGFYNPNCIGRVGNSRWGKKTVRVDTHNLLQSVGNVPTDGGHLDVRVGRINFNHLMMRIVDETCTFLNCS